MDGMLTRTMYENGKDERWRLIADRPERWLSVVATVWNGAELNDMDESGCRYGLRK